MSMLFSIDFTVGILKSSVSNSSLSEILLSNSVVSVVSSPDEGTSNSSKEVSSMSISISSFSDGAAALSSEGILKSDMFSPDVSGSSSRSISISSSGNSALPPFGWLEASLTSNTASSKDKDSSVLLEPLEETARSSRPVFSSALRV